MKRSHVENSTRNHSVRPPRVQFHWFCCLLLLGVNAAFATVDESKLWLPKKYQKHYIGLLKAAEVAEKVERCKSIIEGTLDLGQTKPGHPMFRILCRQQSGRSYNEMIDGISFDPLTTPWPKEMLMTDEELEQLRLEEERKRQAWIDELKNEFWGLCVTAVQAETRFMQNLNWLTVEQVEPLSCEDVEPEAEEATEEEEGEGASATGSTNGEGLNHSESKSLSGGDGLKQGGNEDKAGSAPKEPMIEVKYAIDFDAKNMMGQALHYRAICTIDNERQPELEIKRRESSHDPE